MLLLAVFSTTLFLSAFLLFSVEPMIAKMLLPFLGGTPSVWNICMVFFQAVLLAGYGYAHFVTTKLGPNRQTAIHMVVLLFAALTLPVAISEGALQSLPSESDPSYWLLSCLLTTIGLPFFVLAATAPLLQKWFSLTAHPAARDPYFLYAASNFGSLAALTSYPLVIEPYLRLREQSAVWFAVYVAFALMVLACVALAARSAAVPAAARADRTSVGNREWCAGFNLLRLRQPRSGEESQQVWTLQRLRWVLLAFVPSSLMLGVTTYLTTDIASIPLLWILPLSLYLISFIVVFGKRDFRVSKKVERALAIGAAGLTFLLVSEATQPAWLLIPIHLVFFFLAAWVCHGRLAEERPPVARLTDFYFWISVGGVLGGLFNALLAPNLFSRVAEYPIALILACVVHWKPPNWEHAVVSGISASRCAEELDSLLRRLRWRDILLPIGLGLITVILVMLAPKLEGLGSQWRVALIFGLPVIVGYSLVDRPVRFALALASILLASVFYSGTHGRTLHIERNFFGVLRITIDPAGTSRRLVHGNTIHGRQSTDPARQNEPLSYYHRSGPLGDIFRSFEAKPNANRVAVVGLGTGSILAYAQPNQEWTYFEINPAVLKLARSTNHFTFLSQSSAGRVAFVLGDARLRLREAPDHCYDLIIVDAFSSDAIPVHLITREAIDLYVTKLAPGGVLAFHISNRCLNLEPIIGDLAHTANLVCRASEDASVSPREQRDGKEESHWIVLAREPVHLGKLVRNGLWLPVSGRARSQVWSDDFSNLLHAFKWD